MKRTESGRRGCALVLGAALVAALLAAGCGGGGGGAAGGSAPDPAKGSEWDGMAWDQGRWA